MSSVTRALYDYLQGQSTITDIVSTRIYQEIAPAAAALPRLTFTLVSEDYTEKLDGSVADLHYTTVQLDSWGVTPDIVRSLGEALRLVLQGFVGAMGSESLVVRHCTMRARQVLSTEPVSGGDVSTYRITQEIRVISIQPVPALP